MLIQYALLAVVVVIVGRALLFLFQLSASPLRSVPGPFLARFTRLWYFRRVWCGNFEHENIALHKKYGPIVRIGPNDYSIDDPDSIKTVYGIATKFRKGDWYYGWQHPDPSRWTLFVDRDMKRHAETRKRFQSLYSMSSLVTYEQYVDRCADIFRTRLSEFAQQQQSFDLGHWFQCFAFDVIGEITYSKRFGFLDKGEDVSNILRDLQNTLVYSTMIGIYHEWHATLFSPLSRLESSGAGARASIMKYVGERVTQRRTERETRKKDGKDVEKVADAPDNAPEDFLDKLLDINEEDPVKVTGYHVYMVGLSNIIAGSDTTAASLSAIMYYLLKSPDAVKKLRQELDLHEDDHTSPNVSFKETQNMPYLQAVLKEAMRLHAATGLPLWRVVPEGGAQICGRYFPAGTTVGVNTWVAHYNEKVFEDAKVFRPERWIEAEKEGGDKIKQMDAYYMPFGLGSRSCIGRHISFLEMSKLVPMLIRDFDFEQERPDNEWETKNYWFVKPVNWSVTVKRRQRSSIES